MVDKVSGASLVPTLGVRGKLALLVLLTGQFMANVDTAIVNVANPAIQSGFSATASQLELVVSGYLVAYAVLLTTSAKLSAKFRFDRVFVVGTALFTAASLACGTAGSIDILIAARVLQGFGAALLVAQVLIGIQTSFSGATRARALGWYSITLASASISGQILGGALVTANILGLGWRTIFLVNVPVGVALLVTAQRVVPRQPTMPHRRIDVGGVLALSSTLALLIVPLIFGPDLGWDVWAWVCLALVIPLGAAFFAIERHTVRRGNDPVVNVQVLRWRPIAWAVITNVAGGASYFAALFVLALYLQRGLGLSALESGLTLVLEVCAFGIGGPVVSRVTRKAARRLVWVGYLILAVGYLCVAVSTHLCGPNVVLLALLLGITGLGLGLGFNALIRYLTDSVPTQWAPDISAFVNTSTQIAAALGIAVFGGVYLTVAVDPGPIAAINGLVLVSVILAGAAVLAAAAGFLSTRTWTNTRPEIAATKRPPDLS
ncbi:MAG TPA: MFS transporter [Pseudonocardiaceae bacterium]|nr:MFS transporter [Pseudonocardiaceae bacterium]